MAEGLRRSEHAPEARVVTPGKRSAGPFRCDLRNQEHLEGQRVIGQRGFEPDTVRVHLSPDLALELSASVSGLSIQTGVSGDRCAQDEQTEQVGEIVIAPQVG